MDRKHRPSGPEHPSWLDDLPVTLWRARALGEFDLLSGGWRDLTGRAPEDALGLDWVQAIHPDDRDGLLGAYGDALDEGRRFVRRVRIRRSGGDYGWSRIEGAPRRAESSSGGLVGLIGPDPDGARDVVDHKVKNALFAVQALARQTLWGTPELERGYRRFVARLVVLARAHDVAMEAGGPDGVPLRSLAREVGAPFGAEGVAFEATGDNLILSHDGALTLALVLHELFARSAEVGALSRPDGKVTIGWSGRGVGKAALRWTETARGLETGRAARGDVGAILIQVMGRSGAPERPGQDPRALTCLIDFDVETRATDPAPAAPDGATAPDDPDDGA